MAQNLKTLSAQLGLRIDPNFFRWQMSGFFAAAFYPTVASTIIRIYLGEQHPRWQEKLEVIIAAVFGTILFCYEAAQACVDKKQQLDVHDLIAYLAGLVVFLSSERIWNWYFNFKEQLGGVNLG